MGPVNPGRQLHRNPPGASKHVPPFEQGDPEQLGEGGGGTAVWHREPLYPEEHWQTEVLPFSDLTHVPPCKQGVLVQSSVGVSQFLPLKPAGQLQV